MGAIPYTRRRGKAGTFYFKRRAPKEALEHLRATVWRDAPTRTHWDISLKTRDWNEAFKRAARHVEDTDALIAGALGQVQEAQEADNAAQRRAQALTEAETRMAQLDPAERAELASAGGVAALEAEARDNADWARIWETGVDLSDANPMPETLTYRQTIADQVERAGDRGSITAIKGMLESQIRIMAKLGLDLDDKLKGFATSDPGLRDVLNHYVETRDLPEQTARQYGYAVRRFTELHGDMPVKDVMREHLRTFEDAIRNLSAGRAGGVQDLPFKAAVDRAKAENLPRITEATQAKHDPAPVWWTVQAARRSISVGVWYPIAECSRWVLYQPSM